MIRDPGPITSLGNGVTSRDVPLNEGEQEGDSPNSGFISRALNGHPIMRFVASTAATMVVAGVLSKVTKEGGLKLVKFAEQKAEGTTGLASRAIKSAKEIRQHLDELQGVSRFIDDPNVADPYGSLVFKVGDKLTTGYDGITSERFGFSFMTAEEKSLAKSGLFGEPPVVWNFRDELQQRLVRAGRRLPYELPAMYVGQKALINPLFGGMNDDEHKKTKWYNPVDVVTDFTKESVMNIATMILPMEVAGAGLGQARNSLQQLRYTENDFRNLTPIQKSIHKNFVNVSEVLSEVGHDFSTVTNKVLKRTTQVSGAFNAAAEEFRAQEQGFVQNLHNLRHGAKAAAEKERQASSSVLKVAGARAKAYFTGYQDPALGMSGKPVNAAELIPAFRGLRMAATAGGREFKALGAAQNVIDDALSYNRILNQNFGGVERDLQSALNRIQTQHASRLSGLAKGIRILGGGGPDSDKFTSGQFYQGMQNDAFKDLLEKQIISRGVAEKDAAQFVNHLNVTPPSGRHMTDPTKIITIGKSKIIENADDDLDFFNQILTRYKGIKGSQNLSLEGDALKQSVERAQAVFTSREFKARLEHKAYSSWNKFFRDDLHSVASGILKPKKTIFQDFMGMRNQTPEKLEFLQRKTAETLGIRLSDDLGRIDSEIIVNKLRQRGIDTNNFTDLRDFLIKNRKMTSGIFQNGRNVFGLEQVTIDEAHRMGKFSHLNQDEQLIIRNIVAKTAMKDPVSGAIGLSRLDGVYRTKSGEVLDFTNVKSTFHKMGNFFASEFKIPLLGFNPTDLFGYNSYTEMAKRSPIQYVSSRTVQPFVPETSGSRSDFHLWHKTKGTKGVLTSYHLDTDTGVINSRQLQGTYRAIPTNTADLLTRHTRYGSANEGMTPDAIRRGTSSKRTFLERMIGEDRAYNFRRKMNFDSEQPNSIFGVLSRFRQRGWDVENESTMSKLLRGETVTRRTGSGTQQIRLEMQNGVLKAVDQTGAAVADIPDAALLKGMQGLSKQAFQYGVPKPVMAHLERERPDLFTFNGRAVSGLNSEKEVITLAEDLINAQPQLARQLRASGVPDPSQVLTSASRMKGLLNYADLGGTSMMAQRSPTISTRLDELKNEIFRYIAQTNQISDITSLSQNDIFLEMQNAVDTLVRSGVISAAQKAEAQAAGLATIFNISAFKTYKYSDSNIKSARDAAATVFNFAQHPKVAELFDPFTEGKITQVSSSIRSKFSPLLSPMKKYLGTAKYQGDELAIDPLGSGQDLTMVPTFGTVFKRNPKAAMMNVLGINTYKNPEGFSISSVPASQAVERLNRYFGTVGMGLDVSKFNGPLDLFARGMVGQRVLPMYLAGTAAMTLDRTAGGMVYGKDQNDQRIYRPLVMGQLAKGVVEGQAIAAGLTPGGMSYEEKKKQLVEGEVPIRQGRFWPLGNTPFKGGKINYYRPSWYRKLQGGAMFTSDTYGSPAEKFLFYNDTSPLRPLDPYRFERKHYEDRPYPVTGEYFSGPWGPLTPILNATVGKILKPQKMMHEAEVIANLGSYSPAGQSGAYDTMTYNQGGLIGGGGGFGGGFGGGASGGPGGGAGGFQAGVNAGYAANSAPSYAARNMTRASLGEVNSRYAQMSYGPPKVSKVMNPRIVPSGTPISPSTAQFQGGEIGYRIQEMAGIYGFGFGNLRESLGFGQADFEHQRAVLQSASKAYGSSRAFWDLNLGGLGDIPLGSNEGIGNLEFSEIVRRFVPKDRTNVDYINPIRNKMGMMNPWLPGAEYYTNFQTGDPFTRVQEGEIRLPGIGYERFNKLHPDATGRYGLIDQMKILGNVAPYSNQYRIIAGQVNKMNLGPDERLQVQEIMKQVADTTHRYDFSPYKYKYSTPEELVQHPMRFAIGRMGEYIQHSDNFILSKTFGKRTAVEDWERSNVYGTTFPQWQNPIQSYLAPMVNKAGQRNPILATATLATAGALFGRTPRARLFGTMIGAATGFGTSTVFQASEAVTGERHIPRTRKQELALEEYMDILNYTKNTRLSAMARQSGNYRESILYEAAAKRTMYGADIYSQNIESLSLAIPKRKREHFKAMINAPVAERERILSTAPRLERRMYEAAWGMDVEKLPDLNEYFASHELPDENWEGWHPNTNIDHVKIKTGQHMGLDMSQMGYYPQQIKEANLSNPSYPDFYGTNDRGDVAARLRTLMSGYGITGTITPVMTPFGSQRINVSAGVR